MSVIVTKRHPDAHRNDWLWEASAGVLSGGAVTNPAGDTIRISAGSAIIRTEDTNQSPLRLIGWVQTDIDFSGKTDNDAHYVYFEWNSGSPQFNTTTTQSDINGNNEIEIGVVIKETPTGGSTVYHLDQHETKMYDIPHAVQEMLEEVFHVQRGNKEGGLILGESADANRYVTLSAGVLWQSLSEFAISAIDTSGADTFDRYYRDGGAGWKSETAQSAWPNTNYDDNSGTLAALTGNFYSTLWFYLETDGDIVMLYGQNEYANFASAEGDTPPSAVPPRLQDHAVLIGRIIFKKSTTPATEVQSVFTTTFGASQVADHGSLAGLTDDDHTQYIKHALATAANDFLVASGSGAFVKKTLAETGAILEADLDHGNIQGIGDDDHTQYALLAGRSGGQTLNGDTAADGNLTFSSTAHGTKGNILVGSGLTLVDEDYGSYDECNAGITRETAQSINSGAFTAIDFTAVTGSRSSWSDVANDYIEVAVPGLYIVIIYVVWASNSTGQRIIRPDFTNGATTQAAGQTQRQAIFNSRDMATTLADFAAAGRVGASVFQDSGGALNMTNCRLVVAKVGF